eukprot:Selendium_serpulae@DN3180_c0_g1_i1.p1
MVVAAAASFFWRRIAKKVTVGKAIFSKKWFSEFGSMWPGQAMSLEIKEVLHEEKSEYQDIKVFESTNHGTVLVLDGVIQCTTFDECSYQEMMAHVPIMAHGNPKKVLVIGGGDGGVVREICRHPSIEAVTLCELDPAVIRVAKQFLPTMTSALKSDPRVTIHCMDGMKFLEDSDEGVFDVIIVDSSDPVGPAEVIFTEPFYKEVHRALKPNGIAATQAECMWIHRETIKEVVNFSRNIFKRVEYGLISIPTYPCGSIGLLCCSKSGSSCMSPSLTQSMAVPDGLKYYTAALHKAAFVLPKFLQDAVPGLNRLLSCSVG